MRRPVAMILIGFQARIEAHAIEQPRMHLRRVAAPVLVGEQENSDRVLIHLGLGLELEQRHRRIAVEAPRRVHEVADPLERRAVVGEITFSQGAYGIRALEPPQHARIQVQRDSGAVRRFRQQ